MSRNSRPLYEFGPFRLDARERILLREGEHVPLPPKAFDLLLALVENSGHVLTKEELVERLWPDSFVEEANLSNNIYKLREVLGDRRDGQKFIETLPRRGYRFKGQVKELHGEGAELLVDEQVRALIVIEEEAGETAPAPVTAAAPPPAHLAPSADVSTAVRRRRARLLALALTASVGLALVFVFALRARRAAPVGSGIHSVAVLPFRPLSEGSRDETLELGMADALITKLGNVRQIAVRPTSAVLKYEGGAQDALAAGREQGVDAVIDGKVQKAGDRIRATVQLLRVSDGASLWADTFDDEFTNVFAIQDSISERAARALVSKLTGDEERGVARHYTDDIRAYQLYLEGRYQWSKFSPEGLQKSIGYFNQAIEADPNYALAYAGLADAYNVEGAYGILSPLDTFPKGESAAEKALRLDDSLAQAHEAAGGLALLYERDWDKAERELERAVELNPNDPVSHELLGYYCEVAGQFDRAESELKRARQGAPLMTVVNMDIGCLAYYRRRYDEALAEYARAHNLDPGFLYLPFYVAQAHERKGEYEQAISECRSAPPYAQDDPGILSALGYAYARSGRVKEARGVLARLDEMSRRRFVSPFMLAVLYTGIGDKDKAFDQLNKAYEVHDPQLIWFHLEPQLDDLHGDPRFSDLLRSMGLRPPPNN